jgi:hypothetical protein
MSTYTPIASVTLSSAQPVITFTGLPQTYTDLVLRCNFTTSDSATVLNMTLNGDTSSNYSRIQIWGNGSGTGDLIQTSQSSFAMGYWQTGSGNQIQSITNLMNYTNSTLYKTWLTRWNQVAGIDNSATASSGTWRSTNAVTSITLTPSTGNIAAGSTFDIYGVANASITNVAKATGGDSVYTDGTYWYHIFRSSGLFTTTQSLNADYLVVAGGGGGGSDYGGGGGGAGGLRSTVTATGGGGTLETALTCALNTAFTVTVGAGGGASTSGSNSSISGSGITTVTSTGGGGGGSGGNGQTGGSGGGGGSPNYLGGSGTANQGYDGGRNYHSTGVYADGGGGGGASAVGADAVANSNGGAGGNGVATSITGSSVTYAGGGGGGGFRVGQLQSGGAGGSGGGGAGGSGQSGSDSPVAGTANTGGGGGGGSQGGWASGGSGIVIVRYAV